MQTFNEFEITPELEHDKVLCQNIKDKSLEQVSHSVDVNFLTQDQIRDLLSENSNLQRALKRAEEKLKSETSNYSSETIKLHKKCEDEEQVRILTEKLQQTRAKLYESKNTCNTLKRELSKAQKLLYSEVGENVTINNLLAQPSGWRGRADQIKLLSQKVSELQIRLLEYQSSQKGSVASTERKSQEYIRNVEREKRQKIESLGIELRQSEVALETNKKKLEASKARIKVLENELNSAKASVAVLNEKRIHDERLIEELNHRVKAVEVRFQEREMGYKNREIKHEREVSNLKNDLDIAQIKISQLRKKLDEREVEVTKLRDSMKVLKFEESERSKMGITNVSNANAGNVGEPSEYVTLALAAEAERERLFELVTVLNRRIDKERSETDSLAESLRNERNKCAKLETRLRKLEIERAGLSKVDSGIKSRSYSRLLGRSQISNELTDVEQARFKMELLQEECLALKARLDTVLRDKSADLETYRCMLDQARKTFQEACRYSNNSAS